MQPFLSPPDLPMASAFANWGDERHLGELVESAKGICILTGAGLSAASGLHTYRGKDGRWNTEEPITHGEFVGDKPKRLLQWRRSLDDFDAFMAASPNAGHEALAKLAKKGHVLVTQNIDGLHGRADPEGTVLELHGNGTRAKCVRCQAVHAIGERIREAVAKERSPLCTQCQYILMPDIVMFGGHLDMKLFARAADAASACDLFIAVGTSLEVHPAAELPRMASRNGAKLVIMVDGVTSLHGNADLLIAGDASAVLERLIH